MSASKVADSSSLKTLRTQISKDIQPWVDQVDVVQFVVQKLSVTVFSNASPNIDIFDMDRNVEDETVLYNSRDESKLSYKISGLSEALDLEIGSIQRFVARKIVGQQPAVQMTVHVLKDRGISKTFSYKPLFT